MPTAHTSEPHACSEGLSRRCSLSMYGLYGGIRVLLMGLLPLGVWDHILLYFCGAPLVVLNRRSTSRNAFLHRPREGYGNSFDGCQAIGAIVASWCALGMPHNILSVCRLFSGRRRDKEEGVLKFPFCCFIGVVIVSADFVLCFPHFTFEASTSFLRLHLDNNHYHGVYWRDR